MCPAGRCRGCPTLRERYPWIEVAQDSKLQMAHLEELRAHVVGGAHKGLGHPLVSWGDGSGDAKVAQLHNAVGAAEAVPAFQVSMDDAL